jgi:hypothetical protein
MTGSSPRRGFTLLIAVILASVASAVGISLASLAFKSVRLSDTAAASSAAFYAADTGLECALYADQKQSTFNYLTHQPSPSITCATPTGSQSVSFGKSTYSGYYVFSSNSPGGYSGGWFPVGSGCARLTAYKYSDGRSYVYSEGVNVCDLSNPHLVERGIYSKY